MAPPAARALAAWRRAGPAAPWCARQPGAPPLVVEHDGKLSLSTVRAWFVCLLGVLISCWGISELEWQSSITLGEPESSLDAKGYMQALEVPTQIDAATGEFSADVASALLMDTLAAKTVIPSHSFANGPDPPGPAVREALERYGLQHRLASLHEETFTFVAGSAANNLPGLQPCDALLLEDCIETTVLSLQLDGEDIASINVVLPGSGVAQAEDSQHECSMAWRKRNLRASVSKVLITVLCCLAVLLPLTMLAIDAMVARPLRRLSHAIAALGSADAQHSLGRLMKLEAGPRSRILEVAVLQGVLDRLVCALEGFGRCMPLALAPGFVQQADRCIRPNTEARGMIIMSSGIMDVASLCQCMEFNDFLLVVSRYLTAMTRVIEVHHGTVLEAMGGKILAFWDSPGSLSGHAGKACAAAVAQHRALALLNLEFAGMYLSPLAMRIEIQTSAVRSGEIGSDVMAAFGFKGDQADVGRRPESPEGHEVGTICCAMTKELIPADAGIWFRRSDTLQAQDRWKDRIIYEVMAQEDATPLSAFRCCTSGTGATCTPIRSVAQASHRPPTEASDEPESIPELELIL